MRAKLLWLMMPFLLAAGSPAFAAQFYITASANFGGKVSPPLVKGKNLVTGGGDLNVTFQANDGYYLAEVKVDKVAVPVTGRKTFIYPFPNVTKNHTIAARFTRDPFVTASSTAGGTIDPKGKVFVTYSTSQPFSIQPSPGFHLKDLLVDGVSRGNELTSWTFDFVKVKHSLKAFFAINTYTVTTDVSPDVSPGGAILPAGPLTVKHGQQKVFTVAPQKGMRIASLTVNGVPATGLPATGPYRHTLTVTGGVAIVATFANIGGNADDLVKTAIGFLTKQDFASASIAFESALNADPNNKDANFGGAITKAIMLVENQTVKDVIARWGVILPPLNQAITASSPVGNPMASLTTATAIVPKTTVKSLATTAPAPAASMTTLLGNALSSLGQKLPILNPLTRTTAKTLALAPADAPTVSEMQAAIDTVIIPELKTIAARLAKVEGSGYTFTVTAAMQGNPYGSAIVLSDGEFYTLDGVLNGVLTLLNMAAAYDLDVADYNTDGTRNDYNAINQDPLRTLNNPSFFTLKTTGAQKMAAALANIKTAVTKAESAFAIVQARSAGQGAFDLSTWTPAQKADFQNTLDTIQQFLSGQVTKDGLTVNAPKFFTAPLTRTELPALGYDVPLDATLSAKYNAPVAAEKTGSYTDYNGDLVTRTEAIYADIVPKSDLPDYTLNGILPLNTKQDNVAGFNGLLPISAGYVLRDANGKPIFDTYYMWPFTTNGTDIYCINNSGNQPAVRKITTAGVVTDVATLSDWYNALVWYNGSFYLGKWDVNNFGLYKFDAGWNLASAPTAQFPLTDNQWISVATASGTDLYYALSSWNEQSGTSTTEIHRRSNLGTAQQSDSLLFTTDNHVHAIAYANGYLYLNDDDLSKYKLDGTRVATYTNGSFDVLLGGNLYETENGKLLKKDVP